MEIKYEIVCIAISLAIVTPLAIALWAKWMEAKYAWKHLGEKEHEIRKLKILHRIREQELKRQAARWERLATVPKIDEPILKHNLYNFETLSCRVPGSFYSLNFKDARDYKMFVKKQFSEWLEPFIDWKEFNEDGRIMFQGEILVSNPKKNK